MLKCIFTRNGFVLARVCAEKRLRLFWAKKSIKPIWARTRENLFTAMTSHAPPGDPIAAAECQERFLLAPAECIDYNELAICAQMALEAKERKQAKPESPCDVLALASSFTGVTEPPAAFEPFADFDLCASSLEAGTSAAAPSVSCVGARTDSEDAADAKSAAAGDEPGATDTTPPADGCQPLVDSEYFAMFVSDNATQCAIDDNRRICSDQNWKPSAIGAIDAAVCAAAEPSAIGAIDAAVCATAEPSAIGAICLLYTSDAADE